MLTKIMLLLVCIIILILGIIVPMFIYLEYFDDYYEDSKLSDSLDKICDIGVKIILVAAGLLLLLTAIKIFLLVL